MSVKLANISCANCDCRHKSLFNQLNFSQIETLDDSKSCHMFDKSQPIFLEGTKPQGMFCINEGNIKIYRTGSQGREQILHIAKAGEFLGYRELLSDEMYTVSAQVIDNAKICFVPRNEFYLLISTDSEFARKLLALVALSLGVMEEKMTNLAQKSVRERLAATLLMLKETYGLDGQQSQVIDLSISREDLANIVGTATETIIRLLSEFKKDGLVELKGKKIAITNASLLARTADFYHAQR